MAIITYPLGLREKANASYPHVGFTLSDQKNNRQFDRIHLYVPAGFAIPGSASFDSVDLGIIGGQGGGGAQSTADTTAMAAFLADSAIGGPAGDILKGQALRQGIALNPQTNLAFGGMGIRQFSFAFKMVSESPEEANVVRKIEMLFRKYMMPVTSGNISLQYPPTFQITFYNGTEVNKFMPKIMPCYLTTVDATYNASGNSFHRDGSPVEVDMTLSFQETKTLTRYDLFDSGDNGQDSELFYKQDKTKTNAKVS
jgi:hypothetical protein